MKRCAAWLLVLGVAACSSGNPGGSPEAVCRRQAYNDPKVKQLTIGSLEEASNNPQANYEYTKALRDATEACLRAKGVAVRGGVEPLRSQ